MKLLTAMIAAAGLIFVTGFAPRVFAFEEGKLLVWIGGDKGYRGLTKVGEKFTEELGIEVTVQYPEDAPGKFQQAAAVGKGPDIFIWAHDRLGEWVQSGLLSSIDPSADVKSAVSDIGWQAFTFNDKLWGYPLAYETVGLIYNKDLVSEPPKSFEDIITLDEKLAAEGKKAILWDYANTYFTWPLLAANGGYAFAEEDGGSYDPKDTGVNNEGARKGAEMLVRLIKEGVMPKGAQYKDMEAGVNQGRIAMMINGPWAWSNLKQSGINFAVATIPAIDGSPGKPFVGVLGAMFNQASPNKDLAVEFMENYVMSVEGLKAIDADVPLGVPANKAFYQELAKDNENIRATMASVELGSPMPSIPAMGSFWSAMASALENMTQERQSPEKALDAAAKRITN
jgi:maltose/maltodextrin transport system substrate-binding protein